MALSISTQPHLFCEGQGREPLDQLLLNHIVGESRLGILVRPLGGKYGLVDRIQGYLAREDVAYIALRDRDLDYVPPNECRLIEERANRPIYATYRACIESYLIDAMMIHDYWQYRYAGTRDRPPEPLPVETITAHVDEAAREIADYQAVRWGLASIKPSGQHYWPRLETSWRDDGKLPPELDFQACLDEARTFFQERYEVPTEAMRWDIIETKAEEYQMQFSSPNFYSEQHYLIWFHGKDLIKAVFRALQVEPIRKQYETWAAQRLDFTVHPDLTELSQKCSALMR